MESPNQAEMLGVEFVAPLSQLVRNCEVFCIADCCGRNAFDVDSFSMLWWIRESGEDAGHEALGQLDAVIEQVSAHKGPVGSQEFCETWKRGSDFADYLGTWRRELNRALVYCVEGCPSPAQQLRDAEDRGKDEFFLTVGRLMGSAADFNHIGNVPAALEIYSLIAELDADEKKISEKVNAARRILAERGERPTGE